MRQDNTASIRWEKVEGALQSPKVMVSNSNRRPELVAEGRLGLIFFSDRDFPVAGLQVQGGEESSPLQGLDCVNNVCQWVGILHSEVIQAPDVDTQPTGPIIFFFTITNAAAHGLCEGLMMHCSSICYTWASSSTHMCKFWQW